VGNIKMHLRETGWGSMDWIVLGQNTDQWRFLVNTVMNINIGKLLNGFKTGGSSRRALLH
jgi:hypothetical protein